MLMYVGSSEAGRGITTLAADGRGRLVPVGEPCPVPAPFFLARHPTQPVLYAANALDDGAVTAVRVGADGALEPFSAQPSGGQIPVHVAVSPDGTGLLCANWGGDGGIAVLPLDEDGALGAATSAARPDRPGPAHAHHVSVRLTPAGKTEVITVYLGVDQIQGYLLESGRLVPTWTVDAFPGTGPRHLAQHPRGQCYVSNELAGTVSTFGAAPGAGLRHLATVGLRAPFPAAPPAAGSERPMDQLAEIVVSPDGRFVHVSSRGPNTIVTFAVAEDGSLTPIGEQHAGGVFPIHFVRVGSWLYVANEQSDQVTGLGVDEHTGGVEPASLSVAVAGPTCLLPWEHA